MSVRVRFECSGCDATAPGTAPLLKRFESFSGRAYGFGQNVTDSIESVTPPGWVAYDPYTHVTYCPDCWSEIEPYVVDCDKRDAKALGWIADAKCPFAGLQVEVLCPDCWNADEPCATCERRLSGGGSQEPEQPGDQTDR